MKYNSTKMYDEILQQPNVMAGLKAQMAPVLTEIKKEFDSKNLTGITLVARGSSDNACAYFKYLCEIYYGIPCTLAAPGVLTIYESKLKVKNQLVLGVSQSGKAADVLEVMKNAKENGSVNVAITNDVTSPMAQYADHHLFLNATKEESVAATKTFTAQLFSLLLLVEELSGEKILNDAVVNIPAGVSKVIENVENIVSVAQKLKDMETCFILGRGLNYSVSLESGLKMQETTYVQAKAFSCADFHHGPFAMIDENSIVILLMPQGNSFKDMVEMQEKCEATGAKVIVYTDSDRKGSFDTIAIPSGSDVETPFYNVVTTQLLVNALSVAKGLTPDAPRGLNKVTITK